MNIIWLNFSNKLLFIYFCLGIKDFSNWPTIPQVFINGEFVGGCDILLEMHRNGELIAELKKAGITSALLEEDESPEKKTKDWEWLII